MLYKAHFAYKSCVKDCFNNQNVSELTREVTVLLKEVTKFQYGFYPLFFCVKLDYSICVKGENRTLNLKGLPFFSNSWKTNSYCFD